MESLGWDVIQALLQPQREAAPEVAVESDES